MYPFKKFGIGEIKNIASNQHKSFGEPILYKLITKPISMYIQKHIPVYITANSITWFGFFSMILSFIATLVYDPSLLQSSRILSSVNFVSVIIYIFTDSIDGLHARATKRTSPFGKILDHFIDSCSLTFCLVSFISSLRLGINSNSYFILSAFAIGFYFSLFSERYTGFLSFGIISGASEGLYLIAFSHIAALIKPNYFKAIITATGLKEKDIFLIIATVCVVYIITGVVTVLFDFYNVKSRKSYLELFSNILKPFILAGLTTPIFYCSKLYGIDVFSGFTIYFNSFSICFLEDYISFMSKRASNTIVYLIAYTFIGVHSTLLYLKINNFYIYFWLMILSTVHFCMRSGSVLKRLAMALHTRIY